MTELKTLKDIKGIIPPMSRDRFVEVDELKHEAIKWVKKWFNESKTAIDREKWNFYIGKAHSLMEFHNITEEELKDE